MKRTFPFLLTLMVTAMVAFAPRAGATSRISVGVSPAPPGISPLPPETPPAEFGPVQFTRTGGAPQHFTETFEHCGSGTCRLVITNGNPDGSKRVSSASVLLNGVQLLGPDDFNQQTGQISVPVVLEDQNTLEVVLNSKPGSFLTVELDCPASPATLSAEGTGVFAPDATTLLTAVRIENDGSAAAENVQVSSIVMDGATLSTPSLPAGLGTIPPGGGAVLQSSFSGGPFTPDASYSMTVNGTYAVDGATYCFSLDVGDLVLPPLAPGSATLGTASVDAHEATGPYPPQPPVMDDEVNRQRWIAPTGPFVPGTPTPGFTSTSPPPGLQPEEKEGVSVIFTGNRALGLSGNNIAEPSGASGGGLVFVTSNTFAAYSTTDGSSFTQLNPGTVFPNDAVGLCCDQIVQYVPGIDRFIWFIQGGNGYRLAVASPAAIISNPYTAWTYWNLTPQVFGQPVGTGFDYPELSVGNGYLYMSWDAGFGGCPTGCVWGFQVARTSLAGLQGGGTITIGFTDPSKARMCWGSHVSQDTGDEVFWAGHNSNSSMRVFSLQEGSNSYYWRDRTISSWPNNTLSSLTPDGQNWLSECGGGFPGNNIIGATRQFNRVWFAWTAGTNSSFQQPHVDMVAFDRNDDFSVSERVQIWNNDYAFGYPALATNACSGEIGLSLEYGGNGRYENHVVGLWGDYVVYVTTASDAGTCRFGDYVTIRQRPVSEDNPGNLFDAFGYGLTNVPGSGTRADIRYVTFGRTPSSCNIIGAAGPVVEAGGAQQGTSPLSTSDDENVQAGSPRALAIEGVAPHPITRNATITFALPSRDRVRATVYDLQGRAVSTLLDDVLEPGHHVLHWALASRRAARLSPGEYVLSISTSSATVTRRLVVIW